MSLTVLAIAALPAVVVLMVAGGTQSRIWTVFAALLAAGVGVLTGNPSYMALDLLFVAAALWIGWKVSEPIPNTPTAHNFGSTEGVHPKIENQTHTPRLRNLSSEIEKTQLEISKLQFQLEQEKLKLDQMQKSQEAVTSLNSGAVAVGSEAWKFFRGLVALLIVLTLGAISGWVAVTAALVVKGTNTPCTVMNDGFWWRVGCVWADFLPWVIGSSVTGAIAAVLLLYQSMRND